MKIESQLRSYPSTQRTVTKNDKTQAGKFQQALDAVPQETKDTFTLSGSVPAMGETPAVPDVRPVIQDADDAAPEAPAPAPTSATEILPGDTTKVKLAKLHQQLEEADYTGMAFDEIQCDIYNRFNDAFNGNMPSILTFGGGPEGEDVRGQFWNEIFDHVWIPMRKEFEAETGIRVNQFAPADFGTKESKAYAEYVSAKYGDLYTSPKMLGYGDMSIEETEQAIIKKYAGKDTLRDFLNMQGELYQSGVLASKLTGWGASAYREAINEQLIKTYFPDYYLGLHGETPADISQSSWDAVLDGKFDVYSFAADMRETLKNSNYFGYNFDIEGAISKAIDYLLEAVDKSQLEAHERLTEQIKREEQGKISEQTERAE